MIAGLALMIQCHLITEDDNNRFISDNQVFQWLVAALDCSVAGKLFHGLEFPVIEIVEVNGNIGIGLWFHHTELFIVTT